jgi:hypothetical protein
MEWIFSLAMRKEAEHPSSTHAWKRISFNTKTRLRGKGPFWPLSLILVLKLIPTFIGQNKKYLSCMC